MLRPSFKRERKRYGEPMLKKVRQLLESVNDTLKGRLRPGTARRADVRGWHCMNLVCGPGEVLLRAA